jgi:hypothetical protein
MYNYEAVQFHKTHNDQIPFDDWGHLSINHFFTSTQTTFMKYCNHICIPEEVPFRFHDLRSGINLNDFNMRENPKFLQSF